jgi:chromosome segregation ATPase
LHSGADASREEREGLVERVDGIAAWINDLDARVRTAELATGDEKTAKELRLAVEALSKHDPKLEKRLTNRVDVLADRLATLASTVSTTAASLVRKDGEIAALRKDLDEGNRRLESLVREFGKSAGAAEVEKLRAAIRAVQAERPARTSDARVDDLNAKVAYLTERVDTLAKTVATTAAGLVGREGEIATLRQRLDEGSTRIEQASVELRRLQGDGSLARRLDALQAALDTTNAGLGARETEVVALRTRIDEAYSRVGTVVAELQGSISTLSSQMKVLQALPGTTEQALEAQSAEFGLRLDGVGERLEALATTVESALSGVVERGAEIEALTSRVDDASDRVDLVVAEFRQAFEQLPVPGSVEGDVRVRLEELGGSVTAVAEQLTALEASFSTQAGEATSRAAALEGVLAEAGARLEALERDRDAVAERIETAGAAWSQERRWVRTQLEELAAADVDTSKAHENLVPHLDQVTARLAAMEREHAAATAEIERVSSALDAEREAVHAQLDALAEATESNAGDRETELALSALAARLQGLETEGAVVASEVARVSTALDAAHESLRAEIDAIATSLSEAGAPNEGSERTLPKLSERLEALEESGAAVASEIARTAALWASELEAIESRLDRVSGTLGQGAIGVHAETEQFLAELPARLEAMERDRRSVATEIARVADTWQAERSSLEGRLGEIATHLAKVESGSGAAASADDIAQLRVAVDGLRLRLASSEQEVAALVGARDTSARLDELTRRLESLERAPVVLAGSSGGGPLPGDGRFRLELRAVELRVEHAEAAARENREAVLVQLERLAARIEWRFRRLEEEYEASHPQAVGGGGQVVPIRPTET